MYWAFKSKRALLWELVSTRTVGDNEPVQLAERSWWPEILEEQAPVRRLQWFATSMRCLYERTADVFETVRRAAASDLEVAERRREGSQKRYQDAEVLARSLGREGSAPARYDRRGGGGSTVDHDHARTGTPCSYTSEAGGPSSARPGKPCCSRASCFLKGDAPHSFLRRRRATNPSGALARECHSA